jgi:hypothetical protein
MMRHYLRRARELGVIGSVKRGWFRMWIVANRHGQAFWWRVTQSRITRDTDLLAHIPASSVASLIEQLNNRSETSFLLDHANLEDAARVFRQQFPGDVRSILAEADAIRRGDFVLHHHPVHYPDRVDWHADPASGWRWPCNYISLLEPVAYGPDCPADIMLIWALNRHRHLVTLGMAYLLSGDPCYSAAVADHLKSWIATNPPGYGVNWFSSLEIAIRLIAWALTFQLCRGSRSFPAALMLKSLIEQTKFLNRHLTTWEPVPNNHLIGEATALVVVGAVFPECRQAAEWRQIGLRILNEQVIMQTHQDGVNKEQAMGYQRMVIECLMAVVVLSRRALIPPVPVIEDALQRMLDYVAGTCAPDGTMPMWGDADSGHPLALGTHFWDFRPLLALGAVLFGRGDWKFVANRFSAESFWLLGLGGVQAWGDLDTRLPVETARQFVAGGLTVLRHDWTASSDLVCFRCGAFGLGDEVTHAHCDLLSLQLWLAGRPLLVDSGTYTYYGHWRQIMRQTSSHNTLMVDGHEQALPRTIFAWQTIPQAEMIAWECKCVTGSMWAAPDVCHQRTIQHLQPGQWLIHDQLVGTGAHTATWYFHLAPDLSTQRDDDHCWHIHAEAGPFARLITPGNIECQLEPGWYSTSYGHKQQKTVLVGRWHGIIPDNAAQFTWQIDHLGR